MNCRAKHNPALKRRGGNLHPWNLHPRTVIYRRLCLARHFSAGSGRLPSARGFNPMHSPVVSTPGCECPGWRAGGDSLPYIIYSIYPRKETPKPGNPISLLKINPIIIRNTACAIQKNTIFAAIFSRIRQHNV